MGAFIDCSHAEASDPRPRERSEIDAIDRHIHFLQKELPKNQEFLDGETEEQKETETVRILGMKQELKEKSDAFEDKHNFIQPTSSR